MIRENFKRTEVASSNMLHRPILHDEDGCRVAEEWTRVQVALTSAGGPYAAVAVPTMRDAGGCRWY